MVDSITDSDIDRIDTATDPSAFQQGQIEQELRNNPNLTGDAVREFAERVAENREEVREAADDLMDNRLSPNPSNSETIQLRRSDGTLGPRVPETGDVDLDLDGDTGRVTASIEGETVDLGTVDLNAGASGTRQSRFDRARHPEQQGRGRR